MPDRPGRPGPKYRQIANDLRGGITSGQYKPGARLPTKAELQETYGVALNTVDRALEELRREGLVKSEQGAGTFVLKTPGEPEPSPEFQRLAAEIGRLAERMTAIENRQEQIERNHDGASR